VQWLGRVLISGGLLSALAIALLIAVWIVRPAPSSVLLQVREQYPPADRGLIQLLGEGQRALEAIDPTDRPTVSPLKKALSAPLLEQQEEQISAARKAYRIPPRGYEPGTELEVSTFRHVADEATKQGLAAQDLIRLAAAAQTARLTRGYSVPGLVIRAAQPNYRAVITGRDATTMRSSGIRGHLTGVPVPADAPLDPCYPLAVSAALHPEGLGASLAGVSQMPGWSQADRIATAFGLGCLFWWSREPDPERLFAMLGQDSSGDPLLRLAALSGVVQGLNNFLMADDPLEKEEIIAFNRTWANTIAAPWVDDAATAWMQGPKDVESFVLLGRCPAYQGYVERIPAWVASSEPGEQLLATSFMAQPGYVGFLAYAHRASWEEIVAGAPYADREFNRLLFLAYADEVMRMEEAGPAAWPTMIRTGLQAERIDSRVLSRVLGSRAAGSWRVVWPSLKAAIVELESSSTGTSLQQTWPFVPVLTIPACPVPGGGGTEDPAFLDAVDGALYDSWSSGNAALQAAIVEWHLPRMLAHGGGLARWQSRREVLRPWLAGVQDREQASRVLAALDAAP